jgi:integrase
LKSEVKLAPIEALLGEIEGKVWTLPAERMKGGKEHRVPLSAPAMVIVEEMRREYSGDLLSRGQAQQAAEQYGPCGHWLNGRREPTSLLVAFGRRSAIGRPRGQITRTKSSKWR